MTLVVLAAGMASRYGSMKQLDPITETGEFIIDFSIYDAYRAGFDRVVFVIKKENLDVFRDTIGVRAERYLKVEYAFQDMNDVPSEYASLVPARLKPWGTTHAVLSARDIIKDNFAVINADDFYGSETFVKLAEHLKTAGKTNGKANYCMVGYILKNTLTDNGSVSRGVCEIDESNKLKVINERTKIFKTANGADYEEDGVRTPISVESVVSMNCWGFTPDVFDGLAKSFGRFLANAPGEKSECYLPISVGEMNDRGECDVTAYKTDSVWYGVTYKEDKPGVIKGIKSLIDSGEYSVPLWK